MSFPAMHLPSSRTLGRFAAIWLGVLAIVVSLAEGRASNSTSYTYSSNVVALNLSNWKEVVLDSKHAVFVNIGRAMCNHCKKIVPEWEKLAKATQGYATVAYLEYEKYRSDRPDLLGEKVKSYVTYLVCVTRAGVSWIENVLCWSKSAQHLTSATNFASSNQHTHLAIVQAQKESKEEWILRKKESV
jgi:Thioredoxin